MALNLAALYWRVKGNPRQAAFCLIEAILQEVTDSAFRCAKSCLSSLCFQSNYQDIAFTQLAQLILKVADQKTEAARLLLMATGADPDEVTCSNSL